MAGNAGFSERAKEALHWVVEEGNGLGPTPDWVKEVLSCAYCLPGDSSSLEDDPWRRRLVREVLAAFGLWGLEADLSRLLPTKPEVLWDWLFSHPMRQARFLRLLGDPPCVKEERRLWFRAVFSSPLLGLVQLALLSELQDIAQALRTALMQVEITKG